MLDGGSDGAFGLVSVAAVVELHRRGVDQLALDYGTDGAQLAVNPAAGHAPRTESTEIAAWYWEQLFELIDP